MPVTIKSGQVKVKGTNGYVSVDALADSTTASRIAAINAAGTEAVGDIQDEGAAQVAAIEAAGAEVMADIPEDYTELSSDVSNLKSAIDYTSDALKTGYKRLSKQAANASGVLIDNTSFDTDCYRVQAGSKVDITVSSTPCVITFYTQEPESGAVSYDNNRIVINSGSIPTQTVPEGCTWVGIRVATETGESDITPKSYVLQNMENISITVKGGYSGSLDSVKDNSIRYVPSSVVSSPFAGVSACVLYTFEMVTNAYMQIAYGVSGNAKGKRYTRTYISGAWTDWSTFDVLNNFASNPSYFAFGDSLTYGAKWVVADNDQGYEVIQVAKEYQIPTRIAHAIGSEGNFTNKGVGGSYFVGTGNNKIINHIRNTDMTGAKLITIAGGRNDSANPLGSVSSVSGDGTICGAVREIIEYLQTTYPKTQIVWIGVTPNPGSADNSKVFTFVTAGGWSLNTYDEAVSAVCAEYCVPYLNWKLCSYMMHWADFTGAGGNYAHPNNDESYLQMGNYMAGKVSQCYKG